MTRKKSETPYGGSLTALETLFGEEPATAGEVVRIEEVSVPAGQPRKYFDPQALERLSASIAERGVLQPLLVRPAGPRLELVAGERRYRAAKMAGLHEIPVVVKELSDAEAVEIALVENLQREDLNPVEETEGILALLARRLDTTQDDVIQLLNRAANARRGFTDNDVRSEAWNEIEATFEALGTVSPESFRSHRLPLLNMPDDVLEALRSGELAYTKARELGKVKDDSTRQRFLRQAIDDGLSLNAVKALVSGLSTKGQPRTPKLLSSVRRRLTSKHLSKLPKTKRKKLDGLLKQIDQLLSD